MEKYQLTEMKGNMFIFHPAGGSEFSCKLQCQQCAATTKTGAKCKRSVCIGIPYCWTHARLAGLAVKNTEGRGKGLFAYGKDRKQRETGSPAVFKKNDVIAEYAGELISREELARRYNNVTAPYTLASAQKGKYIDAACKRGLGSLANDPRGTGLQANARLSVGRNGGNLKATKNIYHGQEILTSYGRDYWRNHDDAALKGR